MASNDVSDNTNLLPSDLVPLDVRNGRRRSWTWRICQVLLQLPFTLFIRTRAVGSEHIDPDRGGILLSNHQSFLDPIFVGLRLDRPISFLARDSLWKVPIVGWACRNLCAIPISRTAFRGGSVRTAVDRLHRGFLVGIYPEGTRSSGAPKEFRTGFLALVRRSDVPIHPVAIVGADRAMPRGAWFIRPARVTVLYGEPLTEDEVNQLRTAKDDRAAAALIAHKVADLYTKVE